jgi:hypothetical protein
MRGFLRSLFLILGALIIAAGFIAFPEESGDAVAKFLSATQRAAAAVMSYSHAQKS